MRQFVALGIIGSALFATAAVAATTDLDMIDRAVVDFTGSQIGQPGGARLPVDRRLKLTPCRTPLELSWFGRDQRSVQVACPTAGWKIYVAVDGGAVGSSAVRWAGWLYQVMQVSITVLYQVLMLLLALLRLAGAATPRHPRSTPASSRSPPPTTHTQPHTHTTQTRGWR